MSTFETKDSGKRVQFDSGMQRDVTDGKVMWRLVYSGPMLTRWAELLTRGAVKYDADNWMKANGQAELDRFRDSAARHFAQWMVGDTDEDHAAAVIFNINGAEYVKAKMAPAFSFDHADGGKINVYRGEAPDVQPRCNPAAADLVSTFGPRPLRPASLGEAALKYDDLKPGLTD